MKLILALFDVKAEMFMQPFFVPTIGVAYRNLQDEMARSAENNPLATHPGDFEVWQLGTFDDETGVINAQGDEVFPAKLVDVLSLGPKA